jgi:DNA-binding transcriptional LysR family regulator
MPMDLWKIDLNLLVVLDVLLHTRNLTQAGKRLGRTQPAISDALRRLRELLDDEILVRVGQRYDLTPRAQQLLLPLSRVLSNIEDALESRPSFDPATDAREFHVACSDYVASVLFAGLLPDLSREAPFLRIHLIGMTERNVAAAREGDLDLLIAPRGIERKLQEQPLFGDGFMCVASADHPRLGRSLSLTRYLAEPHMEVKLDEPWTSIADLAVSYLGHVRRVDARVPSFVLALHLIRGTSMLVLAPGRLAQRLHHALELRLFAAPFELPRLQESMAWHPRFTSDPAHAWLRARLLAQVAAWPADTRT